MDSTVIIEGVAVPVASFLSKRGRNVAGDLDLSNSALEALPEGLSVSGSVILSSSRIKALPKNLSVGGDLDVSETAIASLPSCLMVGGDLDLTGTKISEIPPGLKIGGSLYLSRSNIKKLPEGFVVSGNLQLSETKVEALPAGLRVKGFLGLNNVRMKLLPKGLSVGGDLNIGDSEIRALPECLTVGGDLSLYETKVEAVSSGLSVGGNFYCAGSRIKALPDDLSVGGDLNIKMTNISSLPQGLSVGGDIDIRETKIQAVPSDCRIGGRLITELTDRTVVFSSTLTGITRAEAEHAAREMGVNVGNKISKGTDFLVANVLEGQEKRNAIKYGIKVLTEGDWLSLLEATPRYERVLAQPRNASMGSQPGELVMYGRGFVLEYCEIGDELLKELQTGLGRKETENLWEGLTGAVLQGVFFDLSIEFGGAPIDVDSLKRIRREVVISKGKSNLWCRIVDAKTAFRRTELTEFDVSKLVLLEMSLLLPDGTSFDFIDIDYAGIDFDFDGSMEVRSSESFVIDRRGHRSEL